MIAVGVGVAAVLVVLHRPHQLRHQHGVEDAARDQDVDRVGDRVGDGEDVGVQRLPERGDDQQRPQVAAEAGDDRPGRHHRAGAEDLLVGSCSVSPARDCCGRGCGVRAGPRWCRRAAAPPPASSSQIRPLTCGGPDLQAVGWRRWASLRVGHDEVAPGGCRVGWRSRSGRIRCRVPALIWIGPRSSSSRSPLDCAAMRTVTGWSRPLTDSTPSCAAVAREGHLVGGVHGDLGQLVGDEPGRVTHRLGGLAGVGPVPGRQAHQRPRRPTCWRTQVVQGQHAGEQVWRAPVSWSAALKLRTSSSAASSSSV